MEGRGTKKSENREEICVHVVSPQSENDLLLEEDNNIVNMDVPPFRQTFFRYSMYGLSEVVKSSSLVYASHHSSEASWLEINKLSVALVGNGETPNLTLYAPTVKEVYFMGHITYPVTAFNMLPQLTSLEKVTFNVGFGGHINEFQETIHEFRQPTPEVPGVTNLEIKVNHQLYHSCSEETRALFNRIVKSIIKHSSDSFPNLKNLAIDLPNIPLFYNSVSLLVHGVDFLRTFFEVIKTEDKVAVRRKPIQQSSRVPFDPCAYFPTNPQYNLLRMVDFEGLYGP